MHKSKPKKFGYEPKTRGPRTRPVSFDERIDEEIIAGRNPVSEAIKAGRPIEKLMIQEGAGGAAGRIIKLAKESGIRIESVHKAEIEKVAGGLNHQGIVAVASQHEYAEMEDIFRLAEERGEDPFILVLDGIEDPHNLGAIMRTCECSGCHGVIIPKRNACGLTASVAKTSAGAIEYVPCVRVTNISRAVDELKERNVWVYASNMDGEKYYDAELTGPVALVIGAEGKGISRLVKEKCDGVVSIPLMGKINSLNASTAAGILMYEVRRKRDEEER